MAVLTGMRSHVRLEVAGLEVVLAAVLVVALVHAAPAARRLLLGGLPAEHHERHGDQPSGDDHSLSSRLGSDGHGASAAGGGGGCGDLRGGGQLRGRGREGGNTVGRAGEGRGGLWLGRGLGHGGVWCLLFALPIGVLAVDEYLLLARAHLVLEALEQVLLLPGRLLLQGVGTVRRRGGGVARGVTTGVARVAGRHGGEAHPRLGAACGARAAAQVEGLRGAGTVLVGLHDDGHAAVLAAHLQL